MVAFGVATRAFAVRGGWENPAGGWDLMFEGNMLPDAAGFSHDNDSDAWDPNLDPTAVMVRTIKGVGDTEDGVTPALNATVLLVDDRETTGANRKFLFTHQLRPKGSTPPLFEVGVTLIARWRLVSPTTSYNNEYGMGNVGVAEDMENDPDWGVGAYYASASEMGFMPPELGGHEVAVDSSNNFHSVWITAAYDPENSSNLLINVYLDGATEPTITFSQTGWDTTSRAAVDNIYFGLTRSPYVGAMELDYIGAKVGAHIPVRAGLRAEAGADQLVHEGDTVYLNGTGSKQASSYFWTQLVQPGDPVVQINDADQAVANFVAPDLDQGVVLTFELTVRKEEEQHCDTTGVTVRAANAPVIVSPNFSARIGHLSATLSWDAIIDADDYWLGIASQGQGQDKGSYTWSSVTGTSYLHEKLLAGWTYYYKLKASNEYGDGPESDELSVTAVPNLALRRDAEPLATVTPTGQDLSVLNDGQTDANAFYSDDGINYAEKDWYGYTWSTSMRVDRAVYYAGQNRPDGGWWKSLTVEHSQDGGETWQRPDFVALSPDYPFENVPTARPDYSRYVLSFPAASANALRIIGAPGGSSYYTGVAELEVYGPAFDDEVYVYAGEDRAAVEGDEVTLDGTQTINAESYLWRQIVLGDELIVTLSDATSRTATFTAPSVTTETVLTFELQVTGVGGPKSDRVKVRAVEDKAPADVQWRLAAPGLRIAYLSWEPASGADTYTVLRSAIPAEAGSGVAFGLTKTEYLDEDAPAGVHFYTIRAVNLAEAADSEQMPVASLEFADLGLTSRDIGKPQPGTTTYDPATGIVTVQANGRDIWDFSDSFRFDYRELSGDFEVIVEAESLVGPRSWGKLGPMIRDSLQSSSVHSYVCSTVMTALSFQGRNVPNSNDHFAAIIDAYSYEFPIYLRLKREGTTFTGFYRRPDGEWYAFSPKIMVVPAMSDSVYAGVAVTSHQAGTLATAQYSHFVVVRQLPSPGAAFRKLPLGFRPGESVSVELTVGVDPTGRPAVLEIVETVPEGTSPIDTDGGEFLEDTITWRLPSDTVQNKIITYTLAVSPDTTLPLSFSGEIVCGKTRAPIPGASILYRSPSPVTDLTVEMLLSANLTWSPRPPAEAVVGYHVYRSADGGEWQKVASFLTETSWTDLSVEAGDSYSYKVTAETANGIETDLGLSPPTPPVRLALEARECEDYDFNGGQSPGGPGADGIAAESTDDLMGTDYFYQNTAFLWYDENVPNLYRPDDPVEILPGDGASGWSIRNACAGDWFRYTFRDIPESDTKVVLRAATDNGVTIEYLWDEVSLGHTNIPKSAAPSAWIDYAVAPFPSVSGDHVLRIKVLEGSCHLDTVGVGYNWAGEDRRIFFSEDFESYNTTAEMQAAGWTIVNGSGDRSGAWQLWSTEGEPIGLADPNIQGVHGTYVISNGDLTFDVELDGELISPAIDCRDYVSVHLRFSKNINIFEDDPDGDPQFCDVDLRVYDEQTSAWGNWTNVYRHDRTGGDDRWPEDIDLSGIADQKQVQLRWHFYETYYDYWFAVDNITVSGVPYSGPRRPIALFGDSVTLFWEHFGAGKYTVQYTDSLMHPDWQNAPGSWPVTGTTWTGDDVSAIPMRFYRVVSE